MKNFIEILLLACFISFITCKSNVNNTLEETKSVKTTNESSINNNESTELIYTIGQLKYNLSTDSVILLIGEPDSISIEIQAGADGSFVTNWVYVNKGINLEMYSDLKGENKKIRSILVTKPCDLFTHKGIGIGSSVKQVYNNYKTENDYSISDSLQEVVIGSIYDGIVFSIEKGKVVKIFIGAAAE